MAEAIPIIITLTTTITIAIVAVEILLSNRTVTKNKNNKKAAKNNIDVKNENSFPSLVSGDITSKPPISVAPSSNISMRDLLMKDNKSPSIKTDEVAVHEAQVVQKETSQNPNMEMIENKEGGSSLILNADQNTIVNTGLRKEKEDTQVTENRKTDMFSSPSNGIVDTEKKKKNSFQG